MNTSPYYILQPNQKDLVSLAIPEFHRWQEWFPTVTHNCHNKTKSHGQMVPTHVFINH